MGKGGGVERGGKGRGSRERGGKGGGGEREWEREGEERESGKGRGSRERVGKGGGGEREWEREGVERERGIQKTQQLFYIHFQSKINVECLPDNQIKSVWCFSVTFPITSHYASVSVSLFLCLSLSLCLSVLCLCLSVCLSVSLCVVSLSNYLEHITAHHLFIRANSSLN